MVVLSTCVGLSLGAAVGFAVQPNEIINGFGTFSGKLGNGMYQRVSAKVSVWLFFSVQLASLVFIGGVCGSVLASWWTLLRGDDLRLVFQVMLGVGSALFIVLGMILQFSESLPLTTLALFS